jgi:lipopolysaccharide transport system ATP-binding protein
MMSDIALRVKNLSKQYTIGVARQRHDTLSAQLANGLRSLLLRNGRSGRNKEVIWALKDVSFDVKRGEVIGIIGRNGAGKSTLLKMLSRITEPTAGRVEIHGRVGSLLEVGTGFHPDLTGRENIYLNGAILGMKKTEIDCKFDEIVAFAEVEKFLDTPVKHYSSGMYVRLAFGVAAHLEPEILIVDEVLAVGDAAFQKKCLNKMEDVGSHGRTVLFVSHNMPAVTRLCGRVVFLDGGKIVADGPSHQVVSQYLTSDHGTSAAREWPPLEKAPGSGVVRLCAVRVRTEDGEISAVVDIRKSVAIEMEYEVLKPGYIFHPHFSFQNQEGVNLFTAQDVDPAWRGRRRPPGRYLSTCWIPGNFFNEGMMCVGSCMRTLQPNTLHFLERDAVAFQVVDSFEGDTARGDYPEPVPGAVRPLFKWETRCDPHHLSLKPISTAERGGL